ncbi:MAG: hypothetical protein LC634_05745 [Sphingomonadales bacterium]|nr:hypothetical protein [Sphingomonadales bacterium]
MQRLISVFMSMLTVGLLFTATAGQAANYRVTLAEATGERTPVIRNAAWVCNGTECATATARSGPANSCVHVVRELGPVTEFTADGEALSEDELAACNARAR